MKPNMKMEKYRLLRLKNLITCFVTGKNLKLKYIGGGKFFDY